MKMTRKKYMGINIFMFFILIVIEICVASLSVFAARDKAFGAAALLLSFFCIVFVFMIILFRGLSRWEVIFNEKELVFTPFFGAQKSIPYSSMQKIKTGGSAYILYAWDGKRLLIFDDFRFENASQAVSFLKSKGVKSEM